MIWLLAFWALGSLAALGGCWWELHIIRTNRDFLFERRPRRTLPKL